MGNLIHLGLQLRIGPFNRAISVCAFNRNARTFALNHMRIKQGTHAIELGWVLNFKPIEYKHRPLTLRRQAVSGEGVAV